MKSQKVYNKTRKYIKKGKTGKNTELKTVAESNARYLLYLDQDHWDYCFPSLTNKLIKYGITIVDNKSGE